MYFILHGDSGKGFWRVGAPEAAGARPGSKRNFARAEGPVHTGQEKEV